jgi:hypothetical protein
MSKEPREYFEDRCEAQIREYRAELDELRFGVDEEPWESGSDEAREVQALEALLNEAEETFREMKIASLPAWPAIQHDLEERFEEIRTGIEAIQGRLRE